MTCSLLDWFVQHIPEIGEFPPVDRLAVGLVLTFPVNSQSEGIEILSTNIVSLNLKTSARDFIYRVNHPQESRTTSSLTINSLATWSVAKPQVIELRVNPDGSQDKRVISEQGPTIRLELDVNTHQETKLEATLELLKSLLKELTTIALEVASGGEATMLN